MEFDVSLKNYRCFSRSAPGRLEFRYGRTAFVGPNGSGKSSVLYALDWFFNGGTLLEEDFHSTALDGDLESEESTDIDVEVTFGELTEEDRRVLGLYGRGERATFRRIWSRLDGEEKMIGNSRQGPGFSAIRKAAKVAEI